MFAQDLPENDVLFRNQRLASALVVAFALAPIFAPAAALIAVGTIRDVASHKVLAAKMLAPRILDAKTLAPRPLGAKFPSVKILARVEPLIAGAAPVRAASLERAEPVRPMTASLGTPRPAFVAPPIASAPARRSDAPTWIMRTFASVTVESGLRLSAGPQVIALAGIRPPAPGTTCRRLDGVVESCAARAEDRLAVLVKNRTVRCQVFTDSPSAEKRGRCRAGAIDLAADLLRNGLGQPG